MTTRTGQYLDLGLLRRMLGRGDFGGSYYIELQFGGEPTLHPQWHAAVEMVKTAGVLVGLSTNGLTMQGLGRFTVSEGLLDLDALTISVDSFDADVYAQMRAGAKLDDLVSSLDHFFELHHGRRRPLVDLQLVATPHVVGSGDLDAAIAFVSRRGWPATVRLVDDCALEMCGFLPAGTVPRDSLCTNPWLSVSVTSAGDVVSCCYMFWPAMACGLNWYGNLYNNTLEEIWTGPRVGRLRQLMQEQDLSQTHCSRCYLRNLEPLHLDIISRLGLGWRMGPPMVEDSVHTGTRDA